MIGSGEERGEWRKERDKGQSGAWSSSTPTDALAFVFAFVSSG